MITFQSTSVQQTEQFARELAAKLRPNDVLAFRGGMGVGKTAFVRGLADGLGDSSEVSSPTFAIVHEYRCTPKLYHFDMYRITSVEDLYSTGFFDYLETGAILAIEWSELIESALPEDVITVTIVAGEGDTRTITVDGSATPTGKPPKP